MWEEVWKCNNAEKEIKLIIFTKSHTTHVKFNRQFTYGGEKSQKSNYFLTVNHQFKSGVIGEDVFIVIDKRGIRIVRSNMTG